MEEFLGVRLEAQHRQRRTARFGLFSGFGDEGAMAAMHAVEIADRHHAAAQFIRHILEMAKNPHAGVPKIRKSLISNSGRIPESGDTSNLLILVSSRFRWSLRAQ